MTSLKLPRLLEDELQIPHVVPYIIKKRSGQPRVDHLAMRIGQPKSLVLKSIGQLRVIKAG